MKYAKSDTPIIAELSACFVAHIGARRAVIAFGYQWDDLRI